MRFLLDENSDARLAAHLRRLGHDVTAIGQDYVRALDDSDVLAIATHEQRILVSNDRHFGELVFRQRRPHAGIILFRLNRTNLFAKISRLNHVLRFHTADLDQFLVVTDYGVRVRRPVWGAVNESDTNGQP